MSGGELRLGGPADRRRFGMAAYAIFEIETTDPAMMAAYREAAAPSVAVHGGRYLVRGGAVTPLEGGWNPDRIVVLEFDSVEQAKAWWNSAEYREPKLLRRAAGKTKMIIVEGV
jgi:uncharacterized protein (DUF1330 family)